MFPNWSLSGNIDWVASPKLFFGVRGGYYLSDQYDTNVTEEPLYHWLRRAMSAWPACQSAFSAPTGFSSIPTNTKVIRDKQTRAYFQADSTTYANFARPAPVQVRRAGGPYRQRCPERRGRATASGLLGCASRLAARDRVASLATTRFAATAWTPAGLHYPGRHFTRTSSACSSRIRGRSTVA